MGDAAKSLDAIVENVVNSPQFRSLITDVIENGQNANQQTTSPATGQSANQLTTSPATTATRQCNRAIQQTSPADSTLSSSRRCQTFSSPVAEFNAIFRRGASSDQSQGGSGTVSSFFPNLTRRSRARQSNASGRRRQSASTSGRSKSNNVFTREVVLLPDPNSKSVVKGNKKAELMKNGYVISSFDFDRSWSEEDVFMNLRKGFQEKLGSIRYGHN
jgi:hypothetical protein